METIVDGLREEYDEVQFEILSTTSSRASNEISHYGFTEKRHGMVLISPEGEPVWKLPGHRIERNQITGALNNHVRQ